MFPRRIFARFIRFNPIAWVGGYICMRVEIYECLPTEGKKQGFDGVDYSNEFNWVKLKT